MANDVFEVSGPYFEDLSVGDEFDQAPSVTITEGHAALHQALFGDRLRLTLDRELAKKVTGRDALLANPNLVCNLAIGQTTQVSQRVLGNLFYRGLIFRQPVFLGDTLFTNAKVVGLKQNRLREDREASGMVALEMSVTNQRGEQVLKFWRCPMIPCQDPLADTGHADDFDFIPSEISQDALKSCVADFKLSGFPSGSSSRPIASRPIASRPMRFKDAAEGLYLVDARDTVTCAPELVRLTLNMAMLHTDADKSVYGKRLVYGGYTISMAAAQITRAFPDLVTILAWKSCSHTGPVFEEDILRTEVSLVNKVPLPAGGMIELHAKVFATRSPNGQACQEEVQVLDWELVALLA